MRARFSGTAFELGDLFRRQLVVKIFDDCADFLESFLLLLKREFTELFDHFCRAHGGNLLRRLR